MPSIKKTFFCIFSFFVLNVQNVYSENVYYSLLGCYYDPSEFENAVIGSYCVQKSGWKIYALTSGPCIKDENFSDDFSKVNSDLNRILKTEGSNRAEIDYFEPTQNSNHQISPNDATQYILEHLKKSTLQMKKGDQLLLSVFAHGESECSSLKFPSKGNTDLGLGIQNIDECELSFLMRGKHGINYNNIKIKDLIPALNELKEKGVKVAVETLNCYGGSSMNTFANNGICAGAFSTAESPLSMCGGSTITPEDRTGSADLFLIQACRGIELKELQKVSLTFNQRDDMRSCLFSNQEGQTPGSLYLLNDLAKTKKQDVSFSEFFDLVRKNDKTSNLPNNTDGPFWIVNQLAFLSTSPLIYINNTHLLPAQEKIVCVDDVENYIERLTDNVEKIISRTLGKNCGMKNEIDTFVKANQKNFQEYFEAFKYLSGLKEMPDQIIDEKFPKIEQDRILNSIKDEFYSRIANVISAAGGRENIPYPFNDRDTLLMYILNPANKNSINNFFKDEEFKKMESIFNEIKEYSNKISQIEKEKIIPLERELYQKIKSSSQFRNCQKLNPKFIEAKQNCEEFKLPYQPKSL